jgi:hypothetical protein
MTGFDKPVDKNRVHRPEELPIPRIEEDKKEKEEFAELPESNKKILNAAIIFYLKSVFETCALLSESKEKANIQQQLLEDLETFKNLLNHLGAKDQSNHPEFAQQLSGLWHKIDQDFNFIKFLEKKSPEIISKLKKLIDNVTHYPPNEEHTFGFYLQEHAGEEWLPFPYMEILSHLHKDHQRAHNSSQISTWISQIDSILDLLE